MISLEKVHGNLSFGTVNQFITLAGDNGGTDQYNTAETLTFSGSSSNSATITANVIVTKIGESDKTVTLQLDNILKVS